MENLAFRSPIVLAEVVRNVEKAKDSAEMGNIAVQSMEQSSSKVVEKPEDEWQLVKSRVRRRKSASSTASEPPVPLETTSQVFLYCLPLRHLWFQLAAPRLLSVYERLSGSLNCQRHPTRMPSSETARDVKSAEQRRGSWIGSGRLMYPKSAMDLPQTKASMAKMAYSRQLLWQRHQVLLHDIVL